MSKKSAEIAVIGMGCWYPGANSPVALWENILSRRQAFRRFREERMPAAWYFDVDPHAPERTYGQLGAFIDGFVFDLAARRVPRSSYLATDITHWLALEVAASALQDGGYLNGSGLPAERTGVIVGNSLTGEMTRANSMRLRWPFLQRLLRETARAEGFEANRIEPLIDAAGARFLSHFPATNEDTLAGALSNTIAGRICGNFDFGGGGYVVDGACASSLLAVATAAAALEEGRVDACLAGGVDISMDPFELVGFAKARALSNSAMRVYDKRGNGFIPGEGCGFVLLKRMEDAIAASDKIYAVVQGWGISSDGRNAITAPKVAGQARAIRAAWERAGRPDFVEGHGTGTAVGDKVELEAIASVLGPVEGRPLGVTSLKSILGHTKAAAGIGAFLKTVMAVNRRIVPPTAGCQEPNPVFSGAASTLYPLLRGEIRDPARLLKGGVSAMGFGGINSHVVLCSGPAPDARIAPALPEAALLASAQDSELFVFGGSSLAALHTQLRTLRPLALEISIAEMADLSAELIAQLPARSAARAAIIADTPETLLRRIDMLLAVDHADGPEVWLQARYDLSARQARIAFVCPGQGSQDIKMGRALIERDATLAALATRMMESAAAATGIDLHSALYPSLNPLDHAGRVAARGALANTALAQPALCLLSFLWAQRLAAFGIVPVALGGHSLGELSALALCGAFDSDALMQLAAMRGQLMTPAAASAAGMTSLQTDADSAQRLCQRVAGYVAIANLNGPQQVVLAGSISALEALEQLAAAEGIKYKRLAVSNGFHSAMVDDAACALRETRFLPPTPLRLDVPLHSTLAAVSMETDLAAHVAEHARSQVDFVSLLSRLAENADLIIEVGPGRVLSGLAEAILGSGGPRCLPVEGSAGRCADLHAVLASAWLRGANLRWDALHAGRLIRPFIAPQERIFIINPCESQQTAVPNAQPLATASELLPLPLPMRAPPATPPGSPPAGGALSSPTVLAALIQGVATRTGFDPASMTANLRLREDLNLDSIKAGEIIASTAQSMGVADRIDPAQLSNHPLEEIAAALAAARATLSPNSHNSVPAPQPAATQPIVAHSAPNAGLRLMQLVVERTGFAAASISAQQRLREDINLDSIKAGEIIASAAQEMGVADLIDPAQLSNYTIEDIGSALTAAQAARQPAAQPSPPVPAANPQPHGPASAAASPQGGPPVQWVRSFGLHATKLAPLAVATDPAGHIIHVVAARPAALEAALCAAGAQCDTLRANTLLIEVDAADDMAPDSSASAALAATVNLLASAVQALTPGVKSVLFVQRTDGRFGLAQPGAGHSVHAFARSLSQERPQLAVAVLDLAPTLDAAQAASALLAAIPLQPGFSASGQDAHGRWGLNAVPLTALCKPRPGALQKGELVLVTGGARGITAACALHLARQAGVRLALVGSTAREKVDDEVLRTLGQLALDGIEARYWCCDLADAAAVAQLVAEVQSVQGPIAAVVHGAGRNTPRRVEQQGAAEALAEMAPKLLGAQHLLDALAATPPRLFCAFTSIIGVSGMVGNAWYAFANESLDLVLGRFCASHPATSALAIAYGVWDEIGMGAKLGSVASLARMGIGALAPADGIARFLDLMLHDPGVRQVVVTQQVDGISTWPGPRVQDDHLRFLQGPVLGVPGVDCRVTLTLHPERDPFVRDHVFGGSFLLPTVFGLEAMAQAAWAARGGNGEVCRISAIALPAPVVVAAQGTRIEVRALVREHEPDIVDCEVRTGLTGFARAHFQATLHFGTPALALPLALPDLPPLAAPLLPERDLYGGLLFQGQRFQKMGPINHAGSDGIIFSGEPGQADRGERWLLGDPYLRDTLLQAGQVLVPQDDALPVAINNITLAAGHADGGLRRIHVKRYHASQTSHFFLAQVVDANGACVEQIDGYEARVLAHHPQRPTVDELMVPADSDQTRLRKRLAQACGQRGLTLPQLAFAAQALHQQPREARREAVRPLLAQLDAARSLHWNEEGRPLTDNGSGVSIAHDDFACLLILGAAGTPGIGCDIEPVKPRELAILGPDLGALVNRLRAEGDSHDTAVTRAWAAGEAIYKAGGQYRALRQTWREGDMVELQADGYAVLSFVAELARGPRRVVAFALPLAPAPVVQSAAAVTLPVPVPAPPASSNSLIDPNCHRVALVHGNPDYLLTRFVVPFDESGSLAGKVPAFALANWMGRLRELALTGMQHALRETLSSGLYGMVTEQAGVSLTGEAAALDVIEAHTRVEALTSGSCVLRFTYFRVDGSDLIRIGDAYQRFGWVDVMGHGIIRAGVFPPFLRRFLEALHHIAPQPPLTPLLVPVVPALATSVNPTTMVESNIVGNLYFGHSFKWPNRLLDHSLWQVLPGLFRAQGKQGELLVTAQRVEYLREAMPFDNVQVSLHIDSIEGSDIVLGVLYQRAEASGPPTRLALGQICARWVQRDSQGRAHSTALPSEWPNPIPTTL